MKSGCGAQRGGGGEKTEEKARSRVGEGKEKEARLDRWRQWEGKVREIFLRRVIRGG